MSDLSLQVLQQQMMNYLTGDELSDREPNIAQQVEEHGGISRGARLHIYKNAYRMRLKETIDNDHELLGMYLGDDLFDQMVDGYIKAYPSNNTSLRHFADFLPEFLAKDAPFKDYPLISELARFERLLMVAFDAADTPRYNRELLLAIPHEQWPSLVFRFHPSVQINHFNFNTVATWQALKQQQAPQPATKISNTWLIWRNKQRLTQFRAISPIEFSLFEMMLKGNDFSSLCDYLLTQALEEDVSQVALNYLLAWIDDGILSNH